MNKFFVFEGVDGCGKTTLCNAIVKRTNWKYISTPTGIFKEQIDNIENLKCIPLSYTFFLCSIINSSRIIKNQIKESSVICDRYLPTLNSYYNAISYTPDFIHLKELPIIKPKKKIHLFAEYDTIKKRLERKGNLNIDELKIIKDKKYYLKLINEYRKECDLEINVTNLTVEEILEQIIPILMEK